MDQGANHLSTQGGTTLKKTVFRDDKHPVVRSDIMKPHPPQSLSQLRQE